MIKLLAFDLDGTLTQHRTELSLDNRTILDKLAEKYSLVMVGAGKCERIYKQMNNYPIDIIGNYGLQCSEYDRESQSLSLVKDEIFPCDRKSVGERIESLREEYGFTEYKGDSVEYHPSGCVTFPILGTQADLADKLAFDPDRSRRRKIYKQVCAAFPEYTVFVGGSSSFDMAPKPYNKYYALHLYCMEKGYRHDEVIFVGDDYGIGGNDESVFLSDFGFLKIDNYLDFGKVVEHLL